MTKVSPLLLLLVLGSVVPSVRAQAPTDPVLFEIPRPVAPPNVGGLSAIFTVQYGASAWGDYDGDGLFDLVLTGRHPTEDGYILRGLLFKNLGYDDAEVPQLTLSGSPLFSAIWLSSAAWGDVDADGLLDLAYIGAGSLTQPYEDTGLVLPARVDPSTREVTYGRFYFAAIQPLHNGSVTWADYDNDGDQDLLVTGTRADGVPVTVLYNVNVQVGLLLDLQPVDAGLPDVAYSDAAWADFDGDADLDVAVTGMLPDQTFVARLYRNDGAGHFTDVGAGLPDLAYSKVAWGDYDSDGDLDLALLGGYPGPRILQGDLAIYRNDGGSFTRVTFDGFEGVFAGDLQWVDYDADGSLDLSVVGALDAFGINRTTIYRNIDHGADMVPLQIVPRPIDFVPSEPAPGLLFGTIGWADYDGDKDLDVFITGEASGDETVTQLYQSLLIDILPGEHGDDSAANDPPAAPTGLQAEVAGRDVTLRWQAASDPNSPSPGLTYNVRVGTVRGGIDVMPPMADPVTGTRRVVAIGNAGSNLFWRLKSLHPGTYYWSVQAIDPGYLGSPFPQEGTFTIQ